MLAYPLHMGLQRWVAQLNRLYRQEPALHELDFDPEGFEWIDSNDSQQGVISLLRKTRSMDKNLIIACNFTPVPRFNYRVGAPRAGFWREVLNSDALDYGGSGQGNMGGVDAAPVPYHSRPYSLSITLPPLGAVFFKSEGENRE